MIWEIVASKTVERKEEMRTLLIDLQIHKCYKGYRYHMQGGICKQTHISELTTREVGLLAKENY